MRRIRAVTRHNLNALFVNACGSCAWEESSQPSEDFPGAAASVGFFVIIRNRQVVTQRRAGSGHTYLIVVLLLLSVVVAIKVLLLLKMQRRLDETIALMILLRPRGQRNWRDRTSSAKRGQRTVSEGLQNLIQKLTTTYEQEWERRP
jgi:hypothetical protein